MITLTPALLAELGLTVTRPGYLIELGYSTTLRLSTLGNVSYAARDWVGVDVKVSGLSQDGKGGNKASLTLGNTDGVFGAVVLNEGASDIPVTIYACYAGAPGDCVQVFEGVTDGAELDANKITLSLVSQANKTLFCPRVFIAPPVFNFLQPEGTKFTFGNEVYVLERSR